MTFIGNILFFLPFGYSPLDSVNCAYFGRAFGRASEHLEHWSIFEHQKNRNTDISIAHEHKFMEASKFQTVELRNIFGCRFSECRGDNPKGSKNINEEWTFGFLSSIFHP